MRARPAARIQPLDQKVDPAHTALVVVDVQNDFAMPKGACEVSGDDLSNVAPMLERLKTLLQVAREKEILILYVRMNNDAPYVANNLEEIFARRGLGAGPCQSGTFGSEFVEGTAPVDAPNEIVITKHRFSGFWGTSIDLILRSNGIKTVVMAGIATEVCVDSTARDAAFRDYSVVMLRDCTSSFSRARHDAAHTLFDRSFGVVAESSDVIHAWTRSNVATRGWKVDAKRAAILPTLESRIVPDHTALLVIGMTAHHDPSAEQSVRPMMARSLELLQSARTAGVMIIHVQSDYGDMVSNVGSPGTYGPQTFASAEIAIGAAEVVPASSTNVGVLSGFEPWEGEPVVIKHRFSAFLDSDLELLLRANGIRTVVVAGQPAECCVDTTARDATMRDYHLVVPEDCVAAANAEALEATLTVLRRYFGLVVPARRLVNLWTSRQ